MSEHTIITIRVPVDVSDSKGLFVEVDSIAMKIIGGARATTKHDAPGVTWSAVAAPVAFGPGGGPPDPGVTIFGRLQKAAESSGLRVGQLLIYAANEYAIGAAVSLTGIADEALVGMAEKYAAEHCKP